MAIVRASEALGTVSYRLDRLQRLPDSSPWLFAALTIVPVLVAYLIVAALTVPLPDLVAVSLATQPPIGAGTDRVVLTLSVRNRGGSAVPGAVARYYLEPRSASEREGTLLSEQPLGTMSPGDVTTVSTTLFLPHSLAPGVYTVRACVAPTVPTTEQNRRNNCQRSAPFPMP